MTNAEMETIYAKAGVAQNDIEKIQEKYDFDKINEIIEAAHDPKEALESIHAFYPELEVEKMQEQMDFIQDQLEAAFKGEKTEIPLELTEEELDKVAGGGVFDWVSKHWRIVVGTAVGVVIGAIVGACTGAYLGGPIPAVALGILGAIGVGMIGFGWGSAFEKEHNENSK